MKKKKIKKIETPTKKLKFIPCNISFDKRIDLKEFFSLLKKGSRNNILLYQGVPFIVRVGPLAAPALPKRKQGKDYFVSHIGCAGKSIVRMKDRKTGKFTEEKTPYFIIELNSTTTPKDIIDIILFHELREIYYMEKMGDPQRIAHQKALKEEKKYVEKFLPPREQEIYRKWRRGRSSCEIDIKNLPDDIKIYKV